MQGVKVVLVTGRRLKPCGEQETATTTGAMDYTPSDFHVVHRDVNDMSGLSPPCRQQMFVNVLRVLTDPTIELITKIPPDTSRVVK